MDDDDITAGPSRDGNREAALGEAACAMLWCQLNILSLMFQWPWEKYMTNSTQEQAAIQQGALPVDWLREMSP